MSSDIARNSERQTPIVCKLRRMMSKRVTGQCHISFTLLAEISRRMQFVI